MLPANQLNLESLITIEELEQVKDLRVKELPERIKKIGEGGFAKVFLFKFENGIFCAGKKPKLSLFNKSAEERETIGKVSQGLQNGETILHSYANNISVTAIALSFSSMNELW